MLVMVKINKLMIKEFMIKHSLRKDVGNVDYELDFLFRLQKLVQSHFHRERLTKKCIFISNAFYTLYATKLTFNYFSFVHRTRTITTISYRKKIIIIFMYGWQK